MAHPLNRRDFVKTTIAGFAGAMTVEGGIAAEDPPGEENLVLENDQMAWEFSRTGEKMASTRLLNKLSGRSFPLGGAKEIGLTLSAAKRRIEIPWWQSTFGPDNDLTPQTAEEGYKQGFHQTGFDDSKWHTCLNLGLRGISGADIGLPGKPAAAGLVLNQGRPPIVYGGYGWFRAKFELAAADRGEVIVLNLGGYDETDWKEYWVYVNGVEVGRRTTSGRWRRAGQFRISPNSPAYEALNFDSGKPNVVAVQTHAYDRHYGDLSEDILIRHHYDPVLHDQFITVGEPYLQIANFEIQEVKQGKEGGKPSLRVKLADPSSQIRGEVHYALEGPIRRKWAEIQNGSSNPVLLLDIDLDTFAVDAPMADGGYGYPLTIDDQVFAAVEHPSGFNRWNESTLQLTHFPGRWLKPGEVWRSHSAIIGVAAPGEANRQFLNYLEAHSVRKNKILALYDPFGLTAFTEGTSWALNDHQNAGTLNLLAEWQKRGIKFDYYIPDMSLDTTSDLKRFRLSSFPDGPGEMIKQIDQLGMRFGQWFCVTGGAWSNARYPKMAPSLVPSPQESSHPLYRYGYLADMSGKLGSLCVASEPYFSTLRDAIVHHIKETHVELIKLDCGDYYCNSIQHGHLPGKYSTEESFNRLIDIAQEARKANSEVFVIWYWGIYSPFSALYGDVIFDIRLSMEAASTGDFPALFFRDAVTQALDQGSQFARWVPPKNHDSLGVWLANNWWGNQMETIRWQEGLIMDLARGNMLFPQIWSDIFNFEDHDVEFLARIQGLVKRNERVFLTRRYTIGDAWKDAIYGYCYFDGGNGFIFLNNVSFETRTAKLPLGESIGLRASKGQRLQMRLHHPYAAMLTRQSSASFAAGEEVEIQLRPFEVAMIEVTSQPIAEAGLATRELIEARPRYSYNVSIGEATGASELEMHFADAEVLERRGYRSRYRAFEGTLPGYADGRHHVAVVNTFSRQGRRWRQSQMSELVQAMAMVDGSIVEFTATPDYRQTSNNQWNPWIVFSAPLPVAFAGRRIQFGISSYLPADVETSTKLWVLKQSWKPRMRPLPNCWI
jgi:hypothetical protein